MRSKRVDLHAVGVLSSTTPAIVGVRMRGREFLVSLRPTQGCCLIVLKLGPSAAGVVCEIQVSQLSGFSCVEGCFVVPLSLASIPRRHTMLNDGEFQAVYGDVGPWSSVYAPPTTTVQLLDWLPRAALPSSGLGAGRGVPLQDVLRHRSRLRHRFAMALRLAVFLLCSRVCPIR